MGNIAFKLGLSVWRGEWRSLLSSDVSLILEGYRFWRLEDKIGQTLHYIHSEGKVPQFETKLKFSMER